MKMRKRVWAMSKEWKKTKTIYWSDELRDDFDEVGLKRPPVPEGYKYKRTNPIANFFGAILYHGVAKPIMGVYCWAKGIKYVGKANLNELEGKGAFLYCNHTAITDVFKFQSQCFFWHRRVNILGYSDTLTMPIVRGLAKMLGYLPVPLKGDIKNLTALGEACKWYVVDKRQYVLIYPEAHIWPYYTKIRNFTPGSFNYPAMSGAPVVPIVTTWRKPKIGKKPKQTVYIGQPIFPLEELSAADNKNYLHEECLKAMKKMSESVEQFEYIKYIKKENKVEE